MASDEILVALINESVNAEHRPRRVAALVLIEVLRNGYDFAESREAEVIHAADALAVADEIKDLVAKYRLGGEDAPLPRFPR